ncbi:MAG: hypothetical protein ABI824_20345 [Acidobacteriota bacterium]
MRQSWSLLGLGFLFGGIVFAQATPVPNSDELLTRMKAMEERIRSLEAEVSELKGQKATPVVSSSGAAAQPQPAVVAAVPAPAAAPELSAPTGGGSAAAAKVFNPDISVIGDFLGAAGNGGPRPTPALEMHESEIGLQAILDPYARADFFVSFGEQGVNLEEGYLTFPALPGGFQVKVGKMRAAFGKVNTLHNHVLPWTDRPLMSQNLVGGEDGIDDTGFSISRILPAPGGLFLEGTAQLFRGDSDNVFMAYKRSDVSTVGHLRAYKDITESTNIDLGASYSRGHSVIAEPLINQLYGLDATLHWKPLHRGLYHSFVGRTEFVWDRNGIGNAFNSVSLLLPPSASPTFGTPLGFYVSGDYQLNRRWFVGSRFDRSDRATDSSLHDTGGSLLLTYWPSEFSQIRGQLRRTHYAEGQTANELLFQFLFSIGAHGAHPF